MEVTPARVLYVITKANWGGAQRYVFDLATAALAAGHEVLVVTGAPGELTHRLSGAGVPVHPISSMGRDVKVVAEWKSFVELLRVMREFNPDVVHGNSSKAGGLAGFAARLLGVPRIIFTAHGWAYNESRPWWQKVIIGLAHYGTVLLSHTTICVSDTMRRQALWMPFVRARLVVIRNGIRDISFAQRGEARQTLAPFIAEPVWIGTVAELHSVKQLEVLIRAFAKIRERYPDTALVIMGEGQERKRLEGLLSSCELEGKAHLVGHVEHASRYLKALDVFVLPSRSEGLGYVLLEAGLAELPVIASRVGGIPEIISNTQVGTLVPSGDARMLAVALRTYIDDPALGLSHGTALRKRVLSDFSFDRMVRDTLAKYR